MATTRLAPSPCVATVEFDRAGTSHEGILGLKTTHWRNAGETSDLLRDRFVRRIGKAEPSSDRAGALAKVGNLDSLPGQGEAMGSVC